jgi:hypothetical protein
MQTDFSPVRLRPAPRPDKEQYVNWQAMSNETLWQALQLLSSHSSPFEVQAANEIQRRIIEGSWIVPSTPPPPVENLPRWLKMWPFRLLWSQRPR